MFKEIFRRAKDGFRYAFDQKFREELSTVKFKGEIFWTMKNTQTGEITDGHITNVVTLDASILIARLLKNPLEPINGIFALAVGTGNPLWDPLNPPAATNQQRALETELARKTFSSTNFITASTGAISAIPTNVVDYTTIFTESEAVGPIVEMGLLGARVNSNMAITNPVTPKAPYDPNVDVTTFDILTTFVTFPVINKPATSSFSLSWRVST
jgi:hypothetical protein